MKTHTSRQKFFSIAFARQIAILVFILGIFIIWGFFALGTATRYWIGHLKDDKIKIAELYQELGQDDDAKKVLSDYSQLVENYNNHWLSFAGRVEEVSSE